MKKIQEYIIVQKICLSAFHNYDKISEIISALLRKQKSHLDHGFRSSDPLLFSPTDMSGYVKPIMLGSFSHLGSTSRSSSKEEGMRNIG